MHLKEKLASMFFFSIYMNLVNILLQNNFGPTQIYIKIYLLKKGSKLYITIIVFLNTHIIIILEIELKIRTSFSINSSESTIGSIHVCSDFKCYHAHISYLNLSVCHMPDTLGNGHICTYATK